jgi:flagellar basal body-associated protein FliL
MTKRRTDNAMTKKKNIIVLSILLLVIVLSFLLLLVIVLSVLLLVIVLSVLLRFTDSDYPFFPMLEEQQKNKKGKKVHAVFYQVGFILILYGEYNGN